MNRISQTLAAGFLFLGGCILLLGGLFSASRFLLALSAILALLSGAFLIFRVCERDTSHKEEHSNEDT